MKINRLSFTDHKSGWNAKDIGLGRLTLLVGASGVGKTQILKSLLS